MTKLVLESVEIPSAVPRPRPVAKKRSVPTIRLPSSSSLSSSSALPPPIARTVSQPSPGFSHPSVPSTASPPPSATPSSSSQDLSFSALILPPSSQAPLSHDYMAQFQQQMQHASHIKALDFMAHSARRAAQDQRETFMDLYPTAGHMIARAYTRPFIRFD